MTDCTLHVDGARFADTAADYDAATPTALADLTVTWGRGTTVDQPEPATCRFTVADRSGGATFLDALDVGARIDVWASGDISTGAATDVAVDGGFETLPPGPPGNRVVADPAHTWLTLTVATDRPHTGAQSIHIDDTAAQAGWIDVPPAAFTPGNPAGWDGIPQLADGQVWTWSLAVYPGYAVRTQVVGTVYRDPTGAGARTTVGVQAFVVGDGAWHVVGDSVTVDPSVAGGWLGVSVVVRLGAWIDVAGTWTDQPGTWAQYEPSWIDDQQIVSPADELLRSVLVFSGRLTDMTASIDDVEGTLRVEATAVDQMADLENRYVGDEPWPSQTVAARVAAIVAASGADVDTRLDAPLDALMISRRDVDHQPAGGLLAELAQGIDGVLWSATHATTGPFLWLENPANRTSLGTLVLQGGLVVIVPPTTGAAPGRTVLDGSDLPDDEVSWVRDVTDVITRVDATWLDQTTTPDPTERTVRVADAPAEQTYGVRRYGVTTPLIAEADAINVANRVLVRTRQDDWRVQGLEYDLGLTPPERGDETATVLDVLDGTIRLGRPVVVDDVVHWPGGDTIGFYLEGGVYLFDGAWRLGLIGSPYAGIGQSGGWTTLDPAWQWAQMDPEMAWIDLWGVTGPVTALEAA